jgi:antitoxin (DNA-binding transcriptional repressor) of toxin-antitoxin stability system
MIKLNIHEAKTHLSRYLSRIEKGEKVLLCRRNVPIAVISALANPSTKKRAIGLAKGEFTVPDSFFEPLPDDVVASFRGEGA